MKRNNISFSILVSFNELAWIAVFALALIYTFESQRAKEIHAVNIHLGHEIDDKNKQIGDLQGDIDGKNKQIGDLQGDIDGKNKQIGALQGDIDGKNKQIGDLQGELAAEAKRAAEAVINKKLLGLKGDLHKVAFVVDRSGSMNIGNRWATAQEVIQIWLERLDIQQCTLILFDTTVDQYPADGTLLDVSSPDAEAKRQPLTEFFRQHPPQKGDTDTLAALKRAFAYSDIDTVLLFTDGKPDPIGELDRIRDKRRAEIVAQTYRENIYQFLREQSGRRIPVNAIGLGDYFDPGLGEFLQQVAKITDGTFIGR